jgi:hypothetical protein
MEKTEFKFEEDDDVNIYAINAVPNVIGIVFVISSRDKEKARGELDTIYKGEFCEAFA